MGIEPFDEGSSTRSSHNDFEELLAKLQECAARIRKKSTKDYIDQFKKRPPGEREMDKRPEFEKFWDSRHDAPYTWLFYHPTWEQCASDMSEWASIKKSLELLDLSLDYNTKKTRAGIIKEIEETSFFGPNNSALHHVTQTFPRLMILSQLELQFFQLKKNTAYLEEKYPNSNVVTQANAVYAAVDKAKETFITPPWNNDVLTDLNTLKASIQVAYEQGQNEFQQSRGILLPPGEYNAMNIVFDTIRGLSRAIECLMGGIIVCCGVAAPFIILGAVLVSDGVTHIKRPEIKSGKHFRMFAEAVSKLEVDKKTPKVNDHDEEVDPHLPGNKRTD